MSFLSSPIDANRKLSNSDPSTEAKAEWVISTTQLSCLYRTRNMGCAHTQRFLQPQILTFLDVNHKIGRCGAVRFPNFVLVSLSLHAIHSEPMNLKPGSGPEAHPVNGPGLRPHGTNRGRRCSFLQQIAKKGLGNYLGRITSELFAQTMIAGEVSTSSLPSLPEVLRYVSATKINLSELSRIL